MPRLLLQPDGVVVHAERGDSLTAAIWRGHVQVQTPCGGFGNCGRCRVRFARGHAPAPTPYDAARLSEEELESGWRLSCRSIVTGDAEVEVPTSSRPGISTILTTGRERLIEIDTETVPAGEKNTGGIRLGIAYDIGTTTLVGYLIDLSTGVELAESACLNPQAREGSDVISRLCAVAGEGESATRRLQQNLVRGLNGILRRCLYKTGRVEEDVKSIVAVGNPAMLHFLLGVSTRTLTEAPYDPAFRDAQVVRATSIGLQVDMEATLHTLPLAAGYVGADTVAMTLAELQEADGDTVLALDVGTNGEVVLRHGGRLWCASAAAGPAFEGGNIQQGMRAEPGAITAVAMEGAEGESGLRITSVAGAPPKGICGSGLIDAVAVLLDAGVIEEGGKFASDPPDQWLVRMEEVTDVMSGKPLRAVRLAKQVEGSEGNGVLLTQRDIRELQLAKGSIRAVEEALLREAGIGWGDVDRIILAGAFGSFVRVESAIRIGLLPRLPLERIESVGNAAGIGAKLALRSRAEFRRATELASRMNHVAMAGNPHYEDAFIENIGFEAAAAPT